MIENLEFDVFNRFKRRKLDFEVHQNQVLNGKSVKKFCLMNYL